MISAQIQDQLLHGWGEDRLFGPYPGLLHHWRRRRWPEGWPRGVQLRLPTGAGKQALAARLAAQALRSRRRDLPQPIRVAWVAWTPARFAGARAALAATPGVSRRAIHPPDDGPGVVFLPAREALRVRRREEEGPFALVVLDRVEEDLPFIEVAGLREWAIAFPHIFLLLLEDASGPIPQGVEDLDEAGGEIRELRV